MQGFFSNLKRGHIRWRINQFYYWVCVNNSDENCPSSFMNFHCRIRLPRFEFFPVFGLDIFFWTPFISTALVFIAGLEFQIYLPWDSRVPSVSQHFLQRTIQYFTFYRTFQTCRMNYSTFFYNLLCLDKLWKKVQN